MLLPELSRAGRILAESWTHSHQSCHLETDRKETYAYSFGGVGGAGTGRPTAGAMATAPKMNKNKSLI